MQSVLDEFLYPIRDRVLDHAGLQGNKTLLDVGCGDGLIGFGALERMTTGRVIFSDISPELLDHVASLAQKMGLADRSTYLQASADDLPALADASVDVVTTRSVLIYVADKPAAFREFYRVLRPGGRLSLFEPINRFGYPPSRSLFLGFDVTPVMEITDKVKAVFETLQPVDRTRWSTSMSAICSRWLNRPGSTRFTWN
jgi:ubiquinone/menaquinone biosynthesis C-methylase UbiE